MQFCGGNVIMCTAFDWISIVDGKGGKPYSINMQSSNPPLKPAKDSNTDQKITERGH